MVHSAAFEWFSTPEGVTPIVKGIWKCAIRSSQPNARPIAGLVKRVGRMAKIFRALCLGTADYRRGILFDFLGKAFRENRSLPRPWVSKHRHARLGDSFACSLL